MSEITEEKLAEWERLCAGIDLGKTWIKMTSDYLDAAAMNFPSLIAEVRRLRGILSEAITQEIPSRSTVEHDDE